jgi:hypothetical protein
MTPSMIAWPPILLFLATSMSGKRLRRYNLFFMVFSCGIRFIFVKTQNTLLTERSRLPAEAIAQAGSELI